MTVRRGQPWGTLGRPPADAVAVADDAVASRLVEQCRASGRPVPPLLVRGGDLWRTCGGSGRRPDADELALLPVDLGVVELDDGERCFVAHLVARGWSWWRGPIVAVMNAQYLGRWDVAPRSHPDDGRLDVLRVEAMGLRARAQARSRLGAGLHVPHPSIEERRVASLQLDLARPLQIWLDGQLAGVVRRLSVRCEPDAMLVCV